MTKDEARRRKGQGEAELLADSQRQQPPILQLSHVYSIHHGKGSSRNSVSSSFLSYQNLCGSCRRREKRELTQTSSLPCSPPLLPPFVRPPSGKPWRMR